MASRHSSKSNSSSTSVTAVRSWRRASWVISPCIRAWAPERGGLAGIWDTLRILRRSGLIDADLGLRLSPDRLGAQILAVLGGDGALCQVFGPYCSVKECQ